MIVYHIVIEKTTFGYSLRATGFNAEGARYAGMKVERNVVYAMMISGVMAGLAGAIMVLGTFGYGRVLNTAENYGFDGIAVALVGGCNAIGIFFAGLLFRSAEGGAAADAVDADSEGYRNDHLLDHHHVSRDAERHHLHYELVVKKERNGGERK